MDLAIECDYAYLAIFGSLDDLRGEIPKFLQTKDGIKYKNEGQLMNDEAIMLRVLGSIKSLGVIPLFLSKDPIMAYRTLLKMMVSDLTDEPPINLLTKPAKDMHGIDLLSDLPGIGWERAVELIKQFGSAIEFMNVAQMCQLSGDFAQLEEIKINGRKFGKAAHKIFEVEGIWQEQ
jgi:ERCC4-type nuclease